MIKVGDQVPDFELEDQFGEKFKLSDHKGERVFLSFHPLAWTSVCGDQMRDLERNYDTFKEKGVENVVGFSVDAQPSKSVWAKALSLENIKIVADFEPKGEFAKAVGLYNEGMGTSERAAILIDEEGKAAWVKKYELTELPDIDEIIAAL